jgi:ubiquinone/menaquinone biosynthesis C-methylase UbiE
MRDKMKEKKNKGGSDPQGFDRIVREVFAPIYPIIAEQIIQKTKLNQGKCLDAGCGTGALGRAMANLTDMEVLFFDQSNEMMELVQQYVKEEDLTPRSSYLVGDIHNIPCEDNMLDLVISRGSIPFWDDWEKAYTEIYRVLKKDGKAYIGGGFGNAKLRDEIKNKMSKRNPNWSKKPYKQNMENKRKELPQIMQSINPVFYEIIDDESGFWIYMSK